MSNIDGIECVQLIPKDINTMCMEDLKRERKVHTWARNKLMYGANRTARQLDWMRENKPEIDLTQAERDCEDGKITRKELGKMRIAATKRTQTHMRIEDCVAYGMRLADHETAICNLIDERIEWLKENPTVKKVGRPPKYDPKKRPSKYNQRSMTPEEKLAPRKIPFSKKRIHGGIDARKRKTNLWRKKKQLGVFDRDRLNLIARDRGFYTQAAVNSAVAELFDITSVDANNLLCTRSLTWGQAIGVAVLFEMTPMEFCDVFLKGVFQEVVDGKFVACIPEGVNIKEHA